MRVVIMGCGRVGLQLSIELAEDGHEVTIVDKHASAFVKSRRAQRQDDRGPRVRPPDVLEHAGIQDADAFVAVSSGDNSNIVSARVALEHYHVPKVVARIYDPRRAEIYERLNIPTVATTKWGVKQIQLMLFHDRSEIRESLGGGDLLRLRVPVPAAPVGKSATSINVDGQILVAGVSRGGGGFIPTGGSTLQEGDYLSVIMAKDGMDLLDVAARAAPAEHALMRVVVTGGGAVGRHLAADLADRGHDGHADRAGQATSSRSAREWAPKVKRDAGRRVRAVGARGRGARRRPRSWSPRPATTRTTWSRRSWRSRSSRCPACSPA